MTDEPPFQGKAILNALESAHINFIIIGGFAVTAHGFQRTTKDLDIVPDPDPDNLKRLAGLLHNLNAKVLGMQKFKNEELPSPHDPEALALGGNFVLTTKHGRLDVMQLVSPDLEYADLAAAAIHDQVFGHEVRFCSYHHLVEMKEAAARPEDLQDLKRLKEARGESDT